MSLFTHAFDSISSHPARARYRADTGRLQPLFLSGCAMRKTAEVLGLKLFTAMTHLASLNKRLSLLGCLPYVSTFLSNRFQDRIVLLFKDQNGGSRLLPTKLHGVTSQKTVIVMSYNPVTFRTKTFKTGIKTSKLSSKQI